MAKQISVIQNYMVSRVHTIPAICIWKEKGKSRKTPKMLEKDTLDVCVLLLFLVFLEVIRLWLDQVCRASEY